ncbi:hypothetical protein ACFQ73_29260 [Amycolatopsis japonica]|uniref:hypothetical protein n=1 Tax=Amycolatopsis japonica TaxID=208439 RepID=UPI00367180F9
MNHSPYSHEVLREISYAISDFGQLMAHGAMTPDPRVAEQADRVAALLEEKARHFRQVAGLWRPTRATQEEP